MELYRHHEYLMIRIDTDEERKLLEKLFGERPEISDPPLAGEVDSAAYAKDT